MSEPAGIALLGCGNIARPYLDDLMRYTSVKVIGAFDVNQERARELMAPISGTVYASLEDLLQDDRVDIVVNLSIHHAHFETTTQCLQAGKHVHSEKPLALNASDALTLNQLAEEQGVRLGSSPFSWMSPANQALWQVVRSGQLGTIRMVYAEVNWDMIESWHPNPAPFYQVGSLWDVGVYPITLSTTMFGPVRRVQSMGSILKTDRRTKDGEPFEIPKSDWNVSVMDFESGPKMRLTTSFYTGPSHQRALFEVHGDLGTVAVKDWLNADAEVSVCLRGGSFVDVPFEKTGAYFRWGLAVVDLAEAIRENRPHRATGSQAAHLVEILEAAEMSICTGQIIDVRSSFQPPAPLERSFEVKG